MEKANFLKVEPYNYKEEIEDIRTGDAEPFEKNS